MDFSPSLGIGSSDDVVCLYQTRDGQGPDEPGHFLGLDDDDHGLAVDAGGVGVILFRTKGDGARGYQG